MGSSLCHCENVIAYADLSSPWLLTVNGSRLTWLVSCVLIFRCQGQPDHMTVAGWLIVRVGSLSTLCVGCIAKLFCPVPVSGSLLLVDYSGYWIHYCWICHCCGWPCFEDWLFIIFLCVKIMQICHNHIIIIIIRQPWYPVLRQRLLHAAS